MHYKTIILEILLQRPRLHQQLRTSGILLPFLEQCAQELRSRHEARQTETARVATGSEQMRHAAMEIAVREMEDLLPPEFPQGDREPLSLEAAMAYLRGLTSPG